MQKRYVDGVAAQEFLGLKPRTFHELQVRGAIPRIKVGRLVRFDLAELEAWMRAGAPTDAGAGDRIREAVQHGE